MKTKILLLLFCVLCVLCGKISAAPPRLASAPKNAAMKTATAKVAVTQSPHGIILIWRSEYAGMTNVETIVDSATHDILGAYHEKVRVPASQQSWTNTATTNDVEFFKIRSVPAGQP